MPPDPIDPRSRWVTAARVVSIMGHPLLLLPIAVTVAASQRLPFQSVVVILATTCAALVLVALYVLWGRRHGRFSNLDVSDRKQRAPVFRLALVATGGAAVLMFATGQDAGAGRGALSACVLLLVSKIINERLTKISLHAAFTAFSAALVGPAAPVWCAALAGACLLVGWSRVVLGRHTRVQVALGTVAGAVAGSIPWLWR